MEKLFRYGTSFPEVIRFSFLVGEQKFGAEIQPGAAGSTREFKD